MTVLFAILFIVIAIVLGSKWVCWNVSRSLPVPAGPLRFLRFLIWLAFSVLVSSMIYFLLAGFVAYQVMDVQAFVTRYKDQSGILLTLLGIPYWIGLIFGVRLQYFPKRTSEVAV